MEGEQQNGSSIGRLTLTCTTAALAEVTASPPSTACVGGEKSEHTQNSTAGLCAQLGLETGLKP